MTKTQKIKQHLSENPSYFKWGAARLATKYNCGLRTITNILKDMRKDKKTYLKSIGQ